MNVQEILAEFDIEDKIFDIYSYTSYYRSCDASEKETTAYKAEIMGFELTEDYKSERDVYCGKFYYGPFLVNQDSTGVYIEYPNRALITKDLLYYWENRIYESKNIILRARYAGLVWDFKTHVIGEKPDIKIARIHIQSLIKIVNEDYMPHPILGVQHAERAITLSKKLGQKDLLDEAKQALNGLIIRHGKWNSIGIWGASYKISTECSNSYSQEEQATLISDLEQRFIQLYNMQVSDEEQSSRDPWLLMNLADILADYYSKKNPDKIGELFEKVEKSFDAISDKLVKLQLVGNYSQLHNLLSKYNLKDKASQLSKKIAICGNGIQNEMTEFKEEISISKEDIDSHVNSILKTNIEESLSLFCYNYIPKKDIAVQSVNELAKKAPFVFMIPQSLFDKRGRVTSVIGSIDNDLEGHLILHISTLMKIDSLFLKATIDEGKRRGVFTLDNIISFIIKSPSIKPDRVQIISRGLEAYFSDDFLVAMHLLIPQIEDAIRNIIETEGIHTLKPNKSGKGFQLRILDEILRDPAAIKILTADYANYLRILLTDNRGWNLRNDILHGIADNNIFNWMTADRIIHALLCLGGFR